MDMYELWEKALANTEIIRPRVKELATFSVTNLPYVFLAASSINMGDTVVRQGSIMVEKPSIVLPTAMPHFDGFDFEEDLEVNEDLLMSFLLVRGVQFPSLKYSNQPISLDIYEGGVSEAIKHYGEMLERKEDVDTGLFTGPEDCWQFSVLMFIGSAVSRSAEGDIKRLLDDYHKRKDS